MEVNKTDVDQIIGATLKHLYEVLLMWDDGTWSSVFVVAVTENKVENFVNTDSRFRKVVHHKINNFDAQEKDIPDGSKIIVLVEEVDIARLQLQ